MGATGNSAAAHLDFPIPAIPTISKAGSAYAADRSGGLAKVLLRAQSALVSIRHRRFFADRRVRRSSGLPGLLLFSPRQEPNSTGCAPESPPGSSGSHVLSAADGFPPELGP